MSLRTEKDNYAHILTYTLLIILFIYTVIFFGFASTPRIMTLSSDDAFYYFKIGENISNGNGFTFDGINMTNGFQPLWQYISSFAARINIWSPDVLMRIMYILEIFLLTTAFLFLYQVLKNFFTPKTILVWTIVFLMIVYIPAIDGMESGLNILFMTLLFAYGYRSGIFEEYNNGRTVIFGLLLGLLMLARLDTVFIGASISLFLFLRIFIVSGKAKENLRTLVLVVGMASLVVLPYLVYNKLSFGHLMPISGALKSSFPVISFTPERTFKAVPVRYILFGVCALVYFISSFFRYKSMNTRSIERKFVFFSLWILSFAVVLHFAHTAFFMKWAVVGWHFFPYAMFVSLACCEVVDFFLSHRFFQQFRWLYWAVIVFILAGSAAFNYKRSIRPLDTKWQVAAYETAL